MRWLRTGMVLLGCAAPLGLGGCGQEVEPAAEITGVDAGTAGGVPATVEDYAKRQGGMQPGGAYKAQSGYPGAKR